MNRRRFIASVGAATAGALMATGACAQPAQSIAGTIPHGHPLQESWRAWKTLCLAPEGRVIDGFQNSDSHSEGQSYALTLAAAFDDVEAFDSVRVWTEENLAIRHDALLAWRWRHDQRPRVPDLNNASDGDLFFAWALSAMAIRHNRPELGARARGIAADLARLCVVPHPDGSGAQLFLPAHQGFATESGFIINPSYYMPRAMRELAASTGVGLLDRVAADGNDLMNRMAQTGLVPDWVLVTADGWTTAPERFSANAGYEAMRVPLFAVWSREADLPSARRYATAAAANDPANATTVFNRNTGASLERSPHLGYQAISALISCAVSGTVGSAIPVFSTDQPYYPATLHLMALVAQAEIYPQCVPI
ncbi:MAG: glycosyl hydrolase family 8 [Gemmobacter sp.]|nr:glycosyl hydrolase family 8 [Gemmobacter sp.]